MAKFLVENGIDLNFKNKKGQIPLHLAIESHSDELTRYLLLHKGNWLAKDNQGKTPMDYAALRPSYQNELKEFISVNCAQNATLMTSQFVVDESIFGDKKYDIFIYYHKDRYKPVYADLNTTCSDVISEVSSALGISKIVNDLEILEESSSTKPRRLTEDERILIEKQKWKNKDSKFVIKPKVGSSKDVQMQFRTVQN